MLSRGLQTQHTHRTAAILTLNCAEPRRLLRRRSRGCSQLKIRCSLQYFQDCLGGPKVPRSRFELDVPGCEKALAI